MDLHIYKNIGDQCQTVDNYDCTFPFVYDGMSHWTCITSPRTGVPKDSRWCATDANQTGAFKSVGECKTNCPESK